MAVQLRLAAWAASSPGCLPPLLQLSPTVLQDELMGGCSAEMCSLSSLITRLEAAESFLSKKKRREARSKTRLPEKLT